MYLNKKKIKNLEAMVFAAGRGKRMRYMTNFKAKPLVEINFRLLEEELEIVSIVQSEEKTGVEMEALTAVTISALTIYDMVKGVDKSVYIKDIFLLEKKGGKTGDYKK